MRQLLNLISKKILALFILLVIGFTNVYAAYTPTSKFYVNDYANLLSTSTEQYIINVNTSLESQTGAQVVVVTVPSMEGENLEEYSTNLFRRYGIGDRTKNNGVLLLLALEERQFRIEVGYGLEGALTDGKTGRIQDQYIIPYLKLNKWDEGIKNGFDAIIREVCNEYEITVSSDKPVELYNANVSEFEEYSWLGSLGLVIGAIFGLCVKINRLTMKKGVSYTIIGLLISIGITSLIVSSITTIIGMTIANILGALFMFAVVYNSGGMGISGGHYGGGYSNTNRSNTSTRSTSSSRSTGRSYSGGGGRSGGGGSSRKF